MDNGLSATVFPFRDAALAACLAGPKRFENFSRKAKRWQNSYVKLGVFASLDLQQPSINRTGRPAPDAVMRTRSPGGAGSHYFIFDEPSIIRGRPSSHG